ncbi:alpha/beta hydrolase family protein [Photobacterium rosenbergii]|uniref:Dienelactone hydrolase family protein n=1 Tax=Photobacterium rosenbergii TaxID=294936 RepID=A0ABU3ZCG2_9GAMM|nr:dienelactone hydrolase family protein [Photobacterium rosenbergii]MDV5167608.1 dienelactone hydrolase family protein [Photobacterium rosenbergii]
MSRRLALGCFVLCFSTGSLANYYGESVKVPLVESGFFGKSTINLEATVYKPEGEGPFPTVIFNHGSTGPYVIPTDYTINPWGFGKYLVSKDIALIIPMRRGRGKSEGSYNELYTCDREGINKGLDYALQSLDATYDYLIEQPWVDKNKILLSGNSRGGILSLVYASQHPEDFAGVINFSGGWVGDTCNTGALSQNIEIFKNAAHKLKIPTLFIYGHNDPYYSDLTIQSFVTAYEDAGGQVDFKFYQLGPGVSGHEVFYNYGHLWSYVVDNYLIEAFK